MRQQLERVLTTPGPYFLDIASDSVDIEVIVEKRNDFEVILTAYDNSPEVQAALDRATLTAGRGSTELRVYGPRHQSVSYGGMHGVQYGNNNTMVNSFSSSSSGSRSSTIGGGVYARVLAPRGIDLRVFTTSGSLQVADFVRKITMNSASGSVQLDEVEQVHANLTSGDIRVDKVNDRAHVDCTSGAVLIGKLGTAFAKTISGDINIEQVHREADLESVSGNIEVLRAWGPVSARTMTGSISVPPGARARTMTGRIWDRG